MLEKEENEKKKKNTLFYVLNKSHRVGQEKTRQYLCEDELIQTSLYAQEEEGRGIEFWVLVFFEI